MIIAIDGFSACGKSTFAKAIAKKMKFTFIDTGAMYRAVTLYALENCIKNDSIDFIKLISVLNNVNIEFRYNESTNENDIYLNNRCVNNEIRNAKVSNNVSEISAIKEVRRKLVTMQQTIGANNNIVMDGRDIGTNVFPNADIKLFMTASVDVRTLRRCNELESKGMPHNYDIVGQNLAHRDNIDQTRTENPLRQAEDAIVLDNSEMTPEQQMIWFDELLKSREIKKG